MELFPKIHQQRDALPENQDMMEIVLKAQNFAHSLVN